MRTFKISHVTFDLPDWRNSIFSYFVTRFRDIFYFLILPRFSNCLWFNVVLKKTLKEIFSAGSFYFSQYKRNIIRISNDSFIFFSNLRNFRNMFSKRKQYLY